MARWTKGWLGVVVVLVLLALLLVGVLVLLAGVFRRLGAAGAVPNGGSPQAANADTTGRVDLTTPVSASDQDLDPSVAPTAGAVRAAETAPTAAPALEAVATAVAPAGPTSAEVEAAASAVATAIAEAASTRGRLDRMKEELGSARAELGRVRSETQATATRAEEALTRREGRLEERETRVEALAARCSAFDAQLRDREAHLEKLQEEAEGLVASRAAALEATAGLSAEEAKAELVLALEAVARRTAAVTVRDIEARARTEGEAKARSIVTLAVQRVASEQTTESVVSVLALPSDDMKGRIIGREGRNIRTFESVTGVNVIIDDTPEAVLLSCFDPVRREVGRITLEALVLDGRIHPQRIEDTYATSLVKVQEICKRAAEDALIEAGISEVHEEVLALLGRLRFRTSYGQNVLRHLVETAHIAGTMASELRLDPVLVRRCAFLHDLGKAVTHETPGSHAIIGADLARRYGESAEVVHAIEAHHDEVAPQTAEALLTQASDACSGGRPGARRESLETYVQRLERIEEIAAARPGVERVFAMQAGREVRVLVEPSLVDDVEAQVIAQEVAAQIEEELTYPGQIRVTVVRESRATGLAR